MIPPTYGYEIIRMFVKLLIFSQISQHTSRDDIFNTYLKNIKSSAFKIKLLDQRITCTLYDYRHTLVALQRRLKSRDTFIVQARLTRSWSSWSLSSSSPEPAVSFRDRIAKINERDDAEEGDRSSIPIGRWSPCNRMTHAW